jgi:lipoprotein-anchoring transpeptidase ErfK/SrfK
MLWPDCRKNQFALGLEFCDMVRASFVVEGRNSRRNLDGARPPVGLFFYRINGIHRSQLIEASKMRIATMGVVAFMTAAILAPAAVSARETVHFDGYAAGTIVVKTNERRLYYVLGDGRAIRYPVGVGRAGKAWSGTAFIAGKYLKPGWSAPAEIRRDRPSLPPVIPGGSAGNPMGAAAMTLTEGEYAIHGTNAPGSIGGFVSYGCIRMYNEDVMDLYNRVSFGTRVVVLR